MTLIVTIGGATADSYGTVAELVTYGSKIGWDIGHGHEDEHERDMRRAAQWLNWSHEWPGMATNADQALAWPRVTSTRDRNGQYIASDEIPRQIKDAQFEMAWLIHGGEDPFVTKKLGVLTASSVKASGVESSKTYAGGSSSNRYPSITAILTGLTGGGGGLQRSVARG